MSGAIPQLISTELRRGGMLYWAGVKPPLPLFKASDAVFDAALGYRVSEADYGKYHGVLAVEEDLGLLRHWPLIVDELVRLIDDEGLLVLRYTPHEQFGPHELMSTIRARCGPDARVTQVQKWADSFQQVVAIEVHNRRPTLSPRSVTFGVITDGNQPDRLERFLESVISMRRPAECEVEIVVCGPATALEGLAISVDGIRLIVEAPSPTRQAWITAKKNQVVAATATDYLVLAHDRYWFEADFLERMHSFGGFDLLIPSQYTKDGFRYPSLVATEEAWRIGQVAELEHGDYSNTVYINGGIVLARTSVLAEVPFNELLFWGESEDVEISRRLSQAGYVPRHSDSVRVLTDVTRSDQIAVFERLPQALEHIEPDLREPLYTMGTRLAFGAATDPLVVFKSGVWIAKDWLPKASGLEWRGTEAPSLAIRPRQFGQGSKLKVDTHWRMDLEIKGVREDLGAPAVLVNGLKTMPARTRNDVVSYEFDYDPLPEGFTFLIQLVDNWHPGLALSSIVLNPKIAPLPLPLRLRFGSSNDVDPYLGPGWSHGESWGRWTIGETTSISLPLDSGSRRKDLVVDLVARVLMPRATGQQNVAVDTLGIPLTTWTFRSQSTQRNRVHVPSWARERDWLDLRFLVGRPVSPVSDGLGPDERYLGMGVEELRVDVRHRVVRKRTW